MSADEGDAPDATRGVEHRLLRLDRVAGRALQLWPLGGLRRGRAVDDRRQLPDRGLAPAAVRTCGWR